MVQINFDDYLYYGYDIRLALESQDDTIECVFNSAGGSFLDGILIHNKLRRCGKKITGVIESRALSAGAVVAMACDTLEMCENALLMFHMPMYDAQGDVNTAGELEEMASVLRKSEDILCTTLASKSGKTKEAWREALKSDLWLTPEEALEAKLIDRIIPIRAKASIENKYPERIVNFLKTSQGKKDMALEDVCKEFGVADEDGLRKLIKNLQPKEPTTVSDTIVNTIVRHRKTALQSLVTDGKATPAIVNKLEVSYVNPDRVRKDLQTDNSEFDNIVDTFIANERIINFGGSSSGTQKLGDNNHAQQSDPNESPVVRDMRKRGTAKK